MKVAHSNAKKGAVMIAAGGTGGHVFPALAVCDYLLESEIPVIWVGTKKGIEARVVPESGIALEFINVQGFRGKSFLQKLQVPFNLFLSLFSVWRLMLRHRVSVVLGLGGYVSAAVGTAAFFVRKPLIIQEQNAVAGSSNRLLSGYASRIFTGFPGVFEEVERAVFVGNPVRRAIAAAGAQKADQMVSGPSSVRQCRILVIGGSLGARPLNQVLPEAFDKLCACLREKKSLDDVELSLKHQVGLGHLDDTKKLYQKYAATNDRALQVEAVEFIDDMEAALLSADLVIARAGALSISELLIMGLPSILVPLPHAIDDHQRLNAEYVSGQGAAKLLPQSELDASSLSDMLLELLADRSQLRNMSVAALRLAKPDAAEVIASACRDYCHG